MKTHTFSSSTQKNQGVVLCKIRIRKQRGILSRIKLHVDGGSSLLQHLDSGGNGIVSESLCRREEQ